MRIPWTGLLLAALAMPCAAQGGVYTYSGKGCSGSVRGACPGDGDASLTLVVPNDRALIGFSFGQQWAVLDPAANKLGLSFSRLGIGSIGQS